MSEKTVAQKSGFLQDDKGTPSSMRLMSMIALLSSIGFGLISIFYKNGESENGLYLTIIFLLAAFAPKAVQKFAEARFSKIED